MDMVTLLCCRTQDIFHSFVQYFPLWTLLYFLFTLDFYQWPWLYGLTLPKLYTGILKIILFGVMNFRNKVMINEDTCLSHTWRLLHSDATIVLWFTDKAIHSPSKTWLNLKGSCFFVQRVPLSDLWLLPKLTHLSCSKEDCHIGHCTCCS